MSQPPNPASPEPSYPAPPPSPGPSTPLQYPGAQTSGPSRTYPGTPPQYPGAQTPDPAHTYPSTPPQYPGGGPQYPGTIPQYPVSPTPQLSAPALSGQPAAAVPQQAATGADDLDYRHRGNRVHLTAQQRHTDATAVGRLVVHLPSLLVSLAVVGAIASTIFGTTGGWLVILAWLASGALVFHRPTERAFAQRVLRLRTPLAEERARLEPIWREVAARAGIDADTYELMVENSPELNASAVAGHVVAVTTYSLNEMPSSNLAAVLAHELGHHTGGHAWAGLLGYWYSLPGRMAWAVARFFARFTIASASFFPWFVSAVVYIMLGAALLAAVMVMWFIVIPLLLAPFLLAYVSRRGELRADQHAAALDFAPKMTEVLYHMQAEEDRQKAAVAAASGKRGNKPGGLARLLSTHPDNYTRIRALEPYLHIGR